MEINSELHSSDSVEERSPALSFVLTKKTDITATVDYRGNR